MKKIFKVAQLRDLLNQVYNEKITFSRFVEILNENAHAHAPANPTSDSNNFLQDLLPMFMRHEEYKANGVYEASQHLFVYFKGEKIKAIPNWCSKELQDKMVNDGWKHTATVNASVFIEQLFNDIPDSELRKSIASLAIR